MEVTNEMKNVDATVSIYNALNVTATISMYGYGSSLMPTLRRWPFTDKDYSVKSYTIVYIKSASEADPNKKFSRNSIGARQLGDQLIYFESRNVTNISRFPSRAFEYSGDDSITYVGFSFNVNIVLCLISHTNIAISQIFTFQSPTAMALVNTTYISEKEFSTVAYDMNTEHFVANISIYGFKDGFKPTDYVNLIGEGL